MNKNIVKAVSVIFLMNMVITGCANSLKDENTALKEELIQVQATNANLENKVQDLSKQLEESKNSGETSASQNSTKAYPLYTANIDSYKKEIGGYININNDVELKEKLVTLTSTLSEKYFDNLPIEVLNIEDVDGKKIAVINLMESKDNQVIKEVEKFKGSSWATLYFQGSTGGQVTSITLIETLLQREYEEQWIDGVKFLYNNETCDYEHVPELGKVNYRR